MNSFFFSTSFTAGVSWHREDGSARVIGINFIFTSASSSNSSRNISKMINWWDLTISFCVYAFYLRGSIGNRASGWLKKGDKFWGNSFTIVRIAESGNHTMYASVNIINSSSGRLSLDYADIGKYSSITFDSNKFSQTHHSSMNFVSAKRIRATCEPIAGDKTWISEKIWVAYSSNFQQVV